MKILALDLATQTGWAAGGEGPVESGVQIFDVKRGESPGMRYLRFTAWITEVIELHKPELVVYEQPFVMRSGAAAEISLGFATRVQEICARLGIEHQPVNGMTLKKWAAGRGNAKKPEMVEAAQRFFPGVRIIDDNHADALCVLKHAIATYGGKIEQPKEARF